MVIKLTCKDTEISVEEGHHHPVRNIDIMTQLTVKNKSHTQVIVFRFIFL